MRKRNVHLIQLLVVDHDGIGADEATVTLENIKYPNRCMAPRVVSVATKSVEWSDEHPLNKLDGFQEAVSALFQEPSQ